MFVLGCITSFDENIYDMRKRNNGPLYFPNGILNMFPVKNISNITSISVDIETNGKENDMKSIEK